MESLCSANVYNCNSFSGQTKQRIVNFWKKNKDRIKYPHCVIDWVVRGKEVTMIEINPWVRELPILLSYY